MSAAVRDIETVRGAAVGPDKAQAIKRAREVLAPAMKGREAPAYPVDALGPLAPACAAIAVAGQVQPAMVGQCLIGAASLLTQGLFNVQTLTGSAPLSLYLLTLGDSGDGKSTAQRVALKPVNEWQRAASKRHNEAVKEAKDASRKGKRSDDAPSEPASPYRLVSDATVEGLRRDLETGPCSQGVFSDEAAAILSGYGMSADHRAKTAGVFSKLWDEGHLSVSRVTGGRVERYGCRVALHWLIQPMAAFEAVGDRLLRELGFWPRFLLAWPEAQAPRRDLPFRADTLPEVGDYWKRCTDLLAVPLPEDAYNCPVIELSNAARAVFGKAFEQSEGASRLGSLKPIKPFGLRAIEQACRVAGVLSAFAGEHEVNEVTARGALALVHYSLQSWLAVVDDGTGDPHAAKALRLYEWLTERPGWGEKLPVILSMGPSQLRSKDARNDAIDLLRAHGLVETFDGRVTALSAAEMLA